MKTKELIERYTNKGSVKSAILLAFVLTGFVVTIEFTIFILCLKTIKKQNYLFY